MQFRLKKYKKYSVTAFLLTLFVVSFFLRVHQLSMYPIGFHFDEVNAGYNAYALLKTGETVKNGPWPLYLDTFGDFRPMGIVYTMMPSIAVFGLNEFAVRFPMALIGSLSPLLVFFLVRKLSKDTLLAGIAGVFLAVSPWHITLSRATSEAVLAVFIALLITYLFSLLVERRTIKWAVFLYISMAVSYISYHPINLFIILFYPVLLLLSYRELWKRKQLGLIAVTVFIVYLIFPFLTGIIMGKSTARLNQVVSIYSQEEQKHLQKQLIEEGHDSNITVARMFHNKVVNATFELGERYVTYLSPKFLLFEGGLPKRYFTPDAGLITIVEFVGLLLLFAPLAFKYDKRVFFLSLAWLLIGVVPAAITTDDQPNISRAVLMLPALQILAALGMTGFIRAVPKKLFLAPLVILILLGVWHLAYFFHQYTVHEKYYQWLDRSFPAKEISQRITGLDTTKKVLVTTNFLDPEMFVFFYNTIDPRIAQATYKNRAHKDEKTLDNLTFVDEACPLQTHPEGYDFVVEHAWCIEPSKFPTTKIPGADGLPLFQIVENSSKSAE